ncbi:MAG: YciI family protein [Janthinobacterium lividum]
MDEFLLLVRSSYPPTRVPLPAHLLPLHELWQEWVDYLKADGSLLALPAHLDEIGKILTKDQPVANGPYVEGDEFIEHLLLIRAADYETATKIAQSCPVLAVGGSVEVRRAL